MKTCKPHSFVRFCILKHPRIYFSFSLRLHFNLTVFQPKYNLISMNKLICICCLLIANELIAQPAGQAIRLNQLGFYPLAKKIAIVVGESQPGSFYILPMTGRDTAFRGRLGGLMQSTNSSLKTRGADFSAFKKPGRYKIYVPGTGYSYAF